jgi:dipeptidyl-peptidase-4
MDATNLRSKKQCATLVALVLFTFSPVYNVFAQQRTLTVETLYDPIQRIDFDGNYPVGLTWFDDNSYVDRRSPQDAFESPLVRVDAVSGDRTPIVDVEQFELAIRELNGFTVGDASAIARQPDHLTNGNGTSVVFEHASDLYHYNVSEHSIRRLTQTPAIELEVSFSPDGKFLAFIQDHDIVVVDLFEERTRTLTDGGAPRVRNGLLDWVYQEEIYGRGNFRGYWWSPDSSRIAYLQLDDRDVTTFPVVDHIPYHPTVEEWEYPKAGDPNPIVKLGVVPVAGGDTTWITFDTYDPNDLLVVDVGWHPDSGQLIFQVQNREQTWLDLNVANPSNGSVDQILRERSTAWVNVLGSPVWLEDGTALWKSERTGWSHLYHIAEDGTVIAQITNGEWEVRDLHGIDQNTGRIFFSATERSPIGSDLYSVQIDGSGLTRLSESSGTHGVMFNRSLTRYIDTWSDIYTPPQVRVHNADGSLIRAIAENKVSALADFGLPKPEFLQVTNRDGFVMEALMVKPPGFDPLKRYPVYQHVYGGPHIQRVRNAWSRETLYWQLLAQRGIVVWVLDNKTASGKGAVSTWPVYQRFGELELRDFEDGLDWLTSQSFVDSKRVGIEGWSYGGYMVTYALTNSTRWSMGIAGGSVTDWRDYDSIYTERYMRTPENNSDGYKRSAPRFRAMHLHGALLLIHGSMDENVHMQNTLQFAYALQNAGKPFDMMIYPKSRHRLGSAELELHRRSKMVDFVTQHLQTEPLPTAGTH